MHTPEQDLAGLLFALAFFAGLEALTIDCFGPNLFVRWVKNQLLSCNPTITYPCTWAEIMGCDQ